MNITERIDVTPEFSGRYTITLSKKELLILRDLTNEVLWSTKYDADVTFVALEFELKSDDVLGDPADDTESN